MTTYYVRTPANGGNDGTGDGSTLAPWATIVKAMTVVGAGDTLIVGTGTYAENTGGGAWAITKNLASFLTIQSETGNAADVIITGVSGGNNTLISGASAYLRFSNLTFGMYAGSTFAFRVNATASNLEFNNCIFAGVNSSTSGIECSIASGAWTATTFTGCTVTAPGSGAGYNGVRITLTGSATASGLTFTNCTIGGIQNSIRASGPVSATLTGCTLTGTTNGISLTTVGTWSLTTCNSSSTNGYALSCNGAVITIDGGTWTNAPLGVSSVIVFGVNATSGGNATTAIFKNATVAHQSGLNGNSVIFGNGCISSQADNITITSLNDYAILVKENTGTEVKNCHLTSGSGAAVYCNAAVNPYIHNNTLTAPAGYGLLVAVGGTGNKCGGIRFDHNAVTAIGTGGIFNWGNASADSGGSVCDYNTYLARGSAKFGTVYGTAAIQTLAALRTAWAPYDHPLNDANSTTSTDYYVRTTGNDSTGDGTTGNPLLTIVKAISLAGAGDTIIIGSGTYAENTGGGAWAISKNLAGWLVIHSETNNPADVIIIGVSGGNNTLISGQTSHIRFNDLTFGMYAGSSFAFRVNATCDNLEFNRCIFASVDNSQQGIYASINTAQWTATTFTDCIVQKPALGGFIGIGLTVTGTAVVSGLAFDNCTIEGLNYGAALTGDISATFTDCAFSGVNNGAMTMITANTVALVNCTGVATAGAALSVNGATSITVTDGTYTNTTGSCVQFGTDADAGGNATAGSMTGSTILHNPANSGHALLVGNGCLGFVVDDVSVPQAYDYGVVVKSNTGTVVRNSNIYGGLNNAGAALYFKGANQPYAHDDILHAGLTGFYLQANGSGVKCQDWRQDHNLFLASGAATCLNVLGAADDAGGGIEDYNVYNLSGAATLGTVRATPAVGSLSGLIAAWNGYDVWGNDTHSRIAGNYDPPFGAMVSQYTNDTDTTADPSLPVARLAALGVPVFKSYDSLIAASPSVTLPDVSAAQTANLGIVATVKATANGAPPANLVTYAANLTTLAVASAPLDIVAIEDEASGPNYSGSVTDYLDELAAAIPPLRALGILVTDSGIQADHLILLACRSLIAGGDAAGALDVAVDALNRIPGYYVQGTVDLAAYLAGMNLTLNEAEAMLVGAVAAGVDRLNMHWEGASILGMTAVYDYLSGLAGAVPILCAKAGQRNYHAEDAKLIAETLRDIGVSTVIWYGLDESGETPLRGLFWQDGDGSLRPSGNMLAEVVADS